MQLRTRGHQFELPAVKDYGLQSRDPGIPESRDPGNFSIPKSRD